MTAPAILVIGNYCQTIVVIRSLAAAGYRVIAERDDRRAYTQYSHGTSEVWRHPPIDAYEDDFVFALQRFLDARPDITLVFPVGEVEIGCLLRHRLALPSSVALVLAEPIAACMDKFKIYQMAAELGIPQQEFQKVSSYDELVSTVARLGYPCVVKPNNSHTAFFGRKAAVLRASADLPTLLPSWPAGNQFLIVQKFAAGFRHNCHFLADRGRVLAYFEQRVLRTDMPDGTGAGVHAVSWAPTPALREHCARLSQRLEYSGAGCAQFLLDDRTGSISFLEINPRLDATCAMPFYCGYDFPAMAVAYAEYRRGNLAQPPENTSAYPAGKHGVSLWRDLLGWRQAVKRKELDRRGSRRWLTNALRTFWRGDFHLTWNRKDPLPTCYRYAKLAASAVVAVVLAILDSGE